MADLTPVRCPKCRRLVHPMQLYPNDAGCGCTPRRIQRQRTKGSKMPRGAIYVGRPTKWGNPCFLRGAHYVIDAAGESHYCAPGEARGVAVRLFREALVDYRLEITPDGLEELRGKDLACWCPLDQPCHADVLLELANGDPL